MKLRIIFFLLFLGLSSISNAQDKEENVRLIDLERKVLQIDNNQLNYKIEKDLLKETYTNNYERINIVVTMLLGVFAVLGYLGMKDIRNIKDRYEKELEKLKKIQREFVQKSDHFAFETRKIDDELKTIIKENQEQNKKIKFIELREKVISLYKNDENTMALDFVNLALEIQPFDISCLAIKASILTSYNQLSAALKIHRKSFKENPESNIALLNLVEALYFSGKIPEAESLIEKRKEPFVQKSHNGILDFFELLKHYHNQDLEALREFALSTVNFDNLNNTRRIIARWSFKDALYFVYHLEDSDLKIVIKNIIWYWDGQLDGKKLLKRLNLPLPEAPEETVENQT